MTQKLTRGKVSKRDKEFVVANHETMSVEDIAARLRRSEGLIRKLIASASIIQQTTDVGDWVARLHSGSFWVEVRKGLIEQEVGYFEQAWASYNNQFGSASDILATDELMIKDLVMLDIFSMRAIAEQANAIRLISHLERSIEIEEAIDAEVRDQVSLTNWRTQISSLQTAKSALTKHHLDYQKQKDTKLRDLKGSRDQRFKQIEESRRNIFELIKELDTIRSRVKEGLLAAKMAIAAEHVKDDWNQVMEFEDGTLDKPFLSPEGELKDDRLQNEQEQADRLQDA
jgi:hypothetical protein